MEKTKVTKKEFETLLKEIDFADLKKDGYGYILLVLASDLLNDALSFNKMGISSMSKRCENQADEIKDFLRTHGYCQVYK